MVTTMMQKQIKAGEYTLSLEKRTLVMGILNVTPDSFSDGGKYQRLDQALIHAEKLVNDGADILDIGGESTRPGHIPVSVDEELRRTIPVIEALVKRLDCPISIDTSKSEVAKAAVEAGASIINDIWGAKKDPQIAKVAAQYQLPIILMHNRTDTNYHSLMEDIQEDLLASVQIAMRQGVKKEDIILDPGIGFAKDLEQNLTVMRNLEQIVALGYPVLLGTSRKSMIGKVLDLPVDQRLEGTAATVALGLAKGCQLIRVHDVKEMVRVARMMDAMLYGTHH
jgi:dihydropteroate synthase